MQHYRLYFWGRSRIAGVEEFHALDDAAAVEAALGYDRGLPMELWNRARLVGSFEAERRSLRG